MLRRSFLGAIAVTGAVGLWAGQRLIAAPTPTNLETLPLAASDLVGNPDYLVVDIREPEEWRQTGVLEGALLLSYRDPAQFLAVVTPLLEPGQKLALVCRSGNRSSRAVQALARETQSQLVDVSGGMNRILASGYRPVAPTRDRGCTTC